MKHTKIKSFIAACPAAATAAGCASFSAYAQNEESGGNYAIVDSGEYQEYLDSLTDEQRKIVAAKEQMLEQLLADKNITEPSGTYATSDTYIDLPGIFTMYRQETDDYCVSACIMSALEYLGIGSPKQSVINELVEDGHFSKIPEYINSMQEQNFYIHKERPSLDELTECIKTDVGHYNVPTFLGIATNKDIRWFYTTSGHCVLSNGISNDLSMIRIADPLGNVKPGVPVFYTAKASDVQQMTRAICW
ncbi:MAG: C39 family peptidase [Oscillospiraceae bacterium]|nr:C39 family peptidase [Oscillospiraceae bacterium]